MKLQVRIWLRAEPVLEFRACEHEGCGMLEVEVKFPIDSIAAIQEKLVQRGACLKTVRQDTDHYFNAPDRDFAKTDEVFRLRFIDDQPYLTYKGPKLDRETKSRREIEISLATTEWQGDKARELIQSLGYRKVGTVSKKRIVLEQHDGDFLLHFCLDEVAEIGQFLEIEIIAPENRYDQARARILAVAGELGMVGSERRSYLHLVLALKKD